MRLKLQQLPKNKHKEMVTGLGWSPDNKLFTVSDEKMVQEWSLDGQPLAKVTDFDSYATCFMWCKTMDLAAGSDIFALGCSDGSFRLMSKNGGRETKKQAHR